jgi:excisionase family DNA binding protein
MSDTNTQGNTKTEQALPLKRRAYSIKEVCRAFNISPATLYRMKTAGQIKLIKVGGATRILEEDLVKLEQGVAK